MRATAAACLLTLTLTACSDPAPPACPEQADRAGGEPGTVTDFADVGGKTEGLAFDGQGDLLVTLIRQGKLLRVDAAGSTTLLASGLNAPTGLAVAPDGAIWVCEYGDAAKGGGKLTQLSASGKTLASFTKAGSRSMVNPNHVAVSSAGVVYMSDSSGFVARVQGGTAALLFDATKQAAAASPNGLALSRDQRTLYVNDLMASSGLWLLALDGQGRLTGQSSPALKASLALADGIALDCHGRLYVTYLGTRLARVTPGSWTVETLYSGGIELQTPANVAFGHGPGFDDKALYITQLGLAGSPTKIKKMAVGFPGMTLPALGQ